MKHVLIFILSSVVCSIYSYAQINVLTGISQLETGSEKNEVTLFISGDSAEGLYEALKLRSDFSEFEDSFILPNSTIVTIKEDWNNFVFSSWACFKRKSLTQEEIQNGTTKFSCRKIIRIRYGQP